MIILGFKKNITAIIVISLFGVLGHFLYEWTNENTVIGLFFPVSDSIWEHLKLIFFPSAIFFAFEYLLSEEKPQNYISSAIKGIFCGMISVVTLYYTFTGIIGKNIDFVNILIFFVAVIVTVSSRNKAIFENRCFSMGCNAVIIGIFILTAFFFMLWSYNPPSLNIFMPPN